MCLPPPFDSRSSPRDSVRGGTLGEGGREGSDAGRGWGGPLSPEWGRQLRSYVAAKPAGRHHVAARRPGSLLSAATTITTAAAARPPTAPRGTVIVYILDQHVTASLLTTHSPHSPKLHSDVPLPAVKEPPWHYISSLTNTATTSLILLPLLTILSSARFVTDPLPSQPPYHHYTNFILILLLPNPFNHPYCPQASSSGH